MEHSVYFPPPLLLLHISQNRLSYIPEAIGMLTGLRKLNLRRNRLENLPDGLFRLHSLEELHVGQNALVCQDCMRTDVGYSTPCQAHNSISECVQLFKSAAHNLLACQRRCASY